MQKPSENSHHPIYKGRHFFLPAIHNENDLPFLGNNKLAKYKIPFEANVGNRLENLPQETLILIYEYLLKNPIDLKHITQVSRRFLSVMMQSVKLNDEQNDSPEWFPFLQAIREDSEHNLLTKNGLTRADFFAELYPNDEAHLEEVVLAISKEDITKGVKYLKEKNHHQNRHHLFNDKSAMETPFGIIVLFSVGLSTLATSIIMTGWALIDYNINPVVGWALIVAASPFYILSYCVCNGYHKYYEYKAKAENKELSKIEAENPFADMRNPPNKRVTIPLDGVSSSDLAEDDEEAPLLRERPTLG